MVLASSAVPEAPGCQGQGGQSLGDEPEVTLAQGIHRQAAQRGHDPHAVAFAVAMRVFPELGIAGPVPGIFDRPPVANVLQQCFCRGPETRDLVSRPGDLRTKSLQLLKD